MHKFTFRLLLAAGLCLLTLAPAGAYAPPESPIRPAEGTLPPVQTVRPSVCPAQDTPPGAPSPEPARPSPAVIQDLPPGVSREETSHYSVVEDAPPGAPTVQTPGVQIAAPEKEEAGEMPGGETAPDSQEPPAVPDSQEEPVVPDSDAKISALLADHQLNEVQSAALRIRLAADSGLLAQLEGNELTQDDLVYLALLNGRTDRLSRYSAWSAAHPEALPQEVVNQVNLDRDRIFYQNPQTAADPASLTVLVNKNYALPAGYEPALEALGSGYGTGSLRPEAAAAFRAMADAAREEGVSLRSVSAYRSYQRQTSTYNRYLSQDRQASVDTYSARPGHSEHQTGLALDINTASIPAHFENTPAFAWLKEHCAQYGFILRYPQGKEGITGYRFEPWHYRYVGLEAAQACMSQGLTFEEYLAQRPEIPSPAKVEI